MQRGFSILEHPSDIGVEARGLTFEEALAEAARGLLSLIIEPSVPVTTVSTSIIIDAPDCEQLVVRFLSEILYLFDAKQLICNTLTIRPEEKMTLRVEIAGEQFNPTKHRVRRDVKAITYHQLSVSEKEGGICIRFFVDI